MDIVTDAICETLSEWAFEQSARVVKYRAHTGDAVDYDRALFWDRCSARAEGHMLDFANRIIERRSK